MKKVRMENIKPGMILGRSIYLADGRILVREKTELTASAISKLKELRLPAIYIETETETKDVVSDETRSDLIQCLSKLELNITQGKVLNLAFCKKSLYRMVDEIVSNQKISLCLTDVRLPNDYVFSHMVHVCIISVKMGLQMGYNQLKLADLATGALFHDLGMTKIAPEILNRIGGLTQKEILEIQTHPKMGYDLLKQSPDISAVSAQVAYQHHERFNGTGYPRGMAGEEIHEFARITAVADVFDAMTTEKLYRSAKSISEAISHFKSQKGIDFDPGVIDILTKIIAPEAMA